MLRSCAIAIGFLLAANPAEAQWTDGCASDQAKPLVDFEVGGRLDRLWPLRETVFSNSKPDDYLWHTGALVDLNITNRGKTAQFQSIGGMYNMALIVTSSFDHSRMANLTFHNQCRALTADEVSERAQTMTDAFRHLGFDRVRTKTNPLFTVMEDSAKGLELRNWKKLSKFLASDAEKIASVTVATLSDKGVDVTLVVENWGRKTGGNPTTFDDGTGRQFGLMVYISSKMAYDGETKQR